MRPYQHALSSARDGRDWQADLPIHEFLDSSKIACADRRHRAILHHVDLGGDLAALAFPEREDVREVARRHVTEDLGHPATLADWFDLVDDTRLPRPVARRARGGPSGVATLVANRVSPAAYPDVEAVSRLLFSPTTYLTDRPERALPLLMNSAGPMIARAIFGAPRRLSCGRMADFAWIAEAVIFTTFGTIPDVGQIVRHWSAEPTMPKAGKAHAHG